MRESDFTQVLILAFNRGFLDQSNDIWARFKEDVA